MVYHGSHLPEWNDDVANDKTVEHRKMECKKSRRPSRFGAVPYATHFKPFDAYS